MVQSDEISSLVFRYFEENQNRVEGIGKSEVRGRGEIDMRVICN